MVPSFMMIMPWNMLRIVIITMEFTTAQFDLVKAKLKTDGKVISIYITSLKSGTPSLTKRFAFGVAYGNLIS